MSTLSAALGARWPGGGSQREAWLATLRLLRADKAAGRPLALRGDGDLQRAASLPADLADAVLPLLLAARAGDTAAARTLDARLAEALPASLDTVHVAITGWSACIAEDTRRAWPGPEGAEVPLRTAQLLRHELDGLELCGGTLRVEIASPIPPLPRALRARPHRPTTAWLPHLDDEGRYSLTPRRTATRQATLLASLGGGVIDASAGCGGNAIACALAGLDVIAIERDPSRAVLLRKNADALGARIEVRTGDADALLTDRDLEGEVVFVDPPWGGPGHECRALCDLPAPLQRLVARAPQIVLKLPRSFDVRSLPGRWTVHLETDTPPGRPPVITMLTCVLTAR
jgi:16S rRNA G966 N2-methylase RsmD